MTLFNQTMHISGDAMAGKTSQSISLSLGPNDHQKIRRITDNLHSTSLLMLQRQKRKQNYREQETLKNFIVMVMAKRKRDNPLSLLFVHWQAQTSHKSDRFPSALPGASQLFMETVHRSLMCPSPQEADGGL